MLRVVGGPGAPHMKAVGKGGQDGPVLAMDARTLGLHVDACMRYRGSRFLQPWERGIFTRSDPYRFVVQPKGPAALQPVASGSSHAQSLEDVVPSSVRGFRGCPMWTAAGDEAEHRNLE